MDYIDVSGWDKNSFEWSIAPENCNFTVSGNFVRLGDRVMLGDDVRLGNRVTLGNNVRLGNRVRLGNGVTLGDDVTLGIGTRLGDDVTLGDDVMLRNWITLGDYVTLGNRVTLGDYVTLGNGVRLGDDVRLGKGVALGDGARLGGGCSEVIDIGFADGYRKAIAQINGVAWIGAGCRWFTLADALAHWTNHKFDRSLTLALMQSAIAIADSKGWKHS